MKIDKKLIKELKEYLDEFNLSEISYQDGNKKVKVAKNLTSAPVTTAHKPGLTKTKEEESGKKHVIELDYEDLKLACGKKYKRLLQPGHRMKLANKVATWLTDEGPYPIQIVSPNATGTVFSQSIEDRMKKRLEEDKYKIQKEEAQRKKLEEQKELLKNYVLSFADNGIGMQKYLNEEISRIKNIISSNTSSDIADKLAAVTELIESFKRAPINDEVLTKIVKLQSLVKELQNNGNND